MTSDNKQIKKLVALSSLTQYASVAVNTVVRFFMTAYLVHTATVGKTLYGIQVLSFQAVLLLGVALSSLDDGIYRFAISHYAHGDNDRMNDTLSAGLLLKLICNVLFAVTTLLAGVFAEVIFDLPPELIKTFRIVFFIMASAKAVESVYMVWLTPAYVTQRLYVFSLGEIIRVIALIISALVIFRLHHPSIITWVALDFGLMVAVGLLVQLPLCRRMLPELRPRLCIATAVRQMKHLVSFSGLHLVGTLALFMFYATDSIIISNLDELGAGMIAYYAVAQRWDPQIRALLLAFVKVLTPMLTSDVAVGNLDRVRTTFTRAIRYTYIMGLYPCLVLILFARPFILYWIGEDFAYVCVPLLRWILMGFIIGIPGFVSVEVLTGCGKIGRLAAFSMACAVGNIVLSIVLVKVFGLGLAGVALGSVSMLVLMNGVLNPWLACRSVELPIIQMIISTCPRAFLGAMPLVAAGLALRRYWEPGNLFVVFLQFAVCGCIYAISVWFISLTGGDKAQLCAAAVSTWKRRSINVL